MSIVVMAGRDLRFAVRTLRRRPVFTIMAATTIALGIGAATSIYSVVDGVLLRPLPFREPGRLVAIWETIPEWKKSASLSQAWDHVTLSIPQYRDLGTQATRLESVGIWSRERFVVSDGDASEEATTFLVSASLLDVLGVRPALGRMFTPGEDVPSGAPVAIVSYEAWQLRYGGAPDILGRIVHFDDGPFTIVGVLPRGLSLGRQGSLSEREHDADRAAEFWRPAGREAFLSSHRETQNFLAVGRLKPGVTAAGATPEIDAILHPKPSAGMPRGAHVVEWHADQTRDARGPLVLLLGAVALLLLIACANVATLLLGEAAGREQEMAARLVLGATRGQLTRQLLVESIVLATIGAAAGILLAWVGTRSLVALAPSTVPGLAGVRVDLRVLAFAVALALVTGAGFGLAPALTLSGARPEAGRFTGGWQSARGRRALQRWMIAGELALSAVLLVGAGLLGRTFERITRVDPGFRADHLLVVYPTFPREFWVDTMAMHRFRPGVVAQLTATPGVVAATGVSLPPFAGGINTASYNLESEIVQAPGGAPVAPATRHPTQWRVVLPGYFSTLGLPIRAGREFTSDDRSTTGDVAIVGEALARSGFGTASPVGRRLWFNGQWRTIVGVAGDAHFNRLSSAVEPTIYTPYGQHGVSGMTLVVRTAGDPAAATAAVRRAITQVEPRAVISSAEVMDNAVQRSYAEERYRAMLIALFGAMAMVLAA